MIIQVERKTAKKLKSMAVMEGETYDSVINRLILHVEKNIKWHQ